MLGERALRRWLERHADSPSVLEGALPARAVWLTGQSSFTHSLLSPGQDRVLDALARHGWDPVRVGFPWTRAAADGGYRATPLAVAGPRNAAQGVLALDGPGTWFAADVARHLDPVLAGTRERLLLLCGSAGLAMLAAALPHVHPAADLRVDVVAIGGVGAIPRLPDGWRGHVVRGDRDRFAAAAGPREASRVVPGDHLSAATGPATAAAVLELVGPALP